jgi:hypothetical protein
MAISETLVVVERLAGPLAAPPLCSTVTLMISGLGREKATQSCALCWRTHAAASTRALRHATARQGGPMRGHSGAWPRLATAVVPKGLVGRLWVAFLVELVLLRRVGQQTLVQSFALVPRRLSQLQIAANLALMP